MATHHTTQTLSSNWSFKRGLRSSISPSLPARTLPTEMHLDLLNQDHIRDPFLDLNELSVRWVGDSSWTYSTKFHVPAATSNTPNTVTELVFEGLDTFATIYLNGEEILKTENMFVEHRVGIDGYIDPDPQIPNVLEIEFESARKKGLELVREHRDEHEWIVHQTEVSRAAVRKAQFHWGWDWGPILMSCGIWKPVRLETYVDRIGDVKIDYEIGEEEVKLQFWVDVWGAACKRVQLAVYEVGTERHVFRTRLDSNGEAGNESKVVWATVHSFEGARLWWPRGYGDQTRYRFVFRAFSDENDDSTLLDTKSVQTGFRKTERVQEPDEFGRSFYFRINGVDVFAGGSCWIPADSFLTRVTADDYREWLELAAEGNQIMIRVWGGGIYESDEFYEICDELGLLVWQDFAFACANYPAYPSFLKSVEQEALQNVRRLRSHPSLVCWCGNNEDYQIVERYGLEYNVKDTNPENWLKTNFPARYLYEELFPKIVRAESNWIPYHPSSPFGNGASTVLKVDPTIGDIHQWNMWHGDMAPYQKLPSMGGRFVSEFGMEAYPHLDTTTKCITKPEERRPGSMTMEFRNKAIGHSRRIVSYVAENFAMKENFAAFTHLTQIMQADAITWAYKSWRRQWGKGDKRQCGGVLVWQLNDCWPTTSWAVADYYKVPKPAYYAMKRCLKPLAISVTREFHDWTMRPADELWKRDTSHIDPRPVFGCGKYSVWISSNDVVEKIGHVIVRFVSVRTGEQVREPLIRSDIEISPNGTTEVYADSSSNDGEEGDEGAPFDPTVADPFVIHAMLSIDGALVSSDTSWPEPVKYLNFPGRGVRVECYTSNETPTIARDSPTSDPAEIKGRTTKTALIMKITAKKPVKGFTINEVQGMRLSDNGFDVIPGEEKIVMITGNNVPVPLTYTWVGELADLIY